MSAAFGRDLEPWIDADLGRSRAGRGRAAAATANPLASWAAMRILNSGGSAIDAAIAAQAVLTAVEPNASGLGGGCLILVAKGVEAQNYDGLGAAPAHVTDRLSRDVDGRSIPAERCDFGGRTVGVPGCLRALEMAHATHGTLPWSRLFDDAVALCEEGYALSPYLWRTINEIPGIKTERMARSLYCGETAHTLPQGSRLRNPDLAHTLRQIARQGAAFFYEGALAQEICAAIAADPFPGLLTPRDLAGYQAKTRAVAAMRHNDTTLLCGSLPAFGAIAVGQILGVAARHGVTQLGVDMSADEIHILVEANRLAFADRASYAGDPDFTEIDVPALLESSYLDARANMLDPARRSEKLMAGAGQDGSMTSHLSIADANGLVVSMTTTINQNFGARIAVGGFYLNNVLTNFAPNPMENGKPSINRMAPSKRPRTSIAPIIVLDRDGPLAAIGAGGGGRIPGYVANAILRLASGLRDPQAILAAPHALNLAGLAEVEAPLDRHAADLSRRGHWVMPRRHDGGTQAIIRQETGWAAGGDPRRDGVGMGLI